MGPSGVSVERLGREASFEAAEGPVGCEPSAVSEEDRYRPLGSASRNASPHLGKPMVVVRKPPEHGTDTRGEPFADSDHLPCRDR